ncbi:hypothetical protein L7F22_034745 [Adiantum nelumboides]|nr:hypothetical protein [Adiantum nelumboides]
MIWYFDSGSSRHITSRKDLFCSLDAAPAGKKVTCANNASYPIKGIGKILITISDGSDLCLPDVLYVPGIKKNLLSVSSLAKNDLRVIFEDDRCIVRDQENGYSLITIGTLENGLFVLDHYEKQIQACIAEIKTQAMQNAELWHARFGHVGYGSLMTLQRHNMVHDLSLLEMPPRHVCEGCVLGKMHRFAFSQDGSVRATRKLQLVHSDTLRTDQGGEYMSGAFKDFLGKKGIKHQCTMPYTPQQNGVAERKNKSLMEMARCMLKAKSLPHKLWMEAVACAAHVLNRCPTRALKTITPYESWYDRKPSVSYLRVFGCLAYAHIPQQLRGKLDDKAVKCIFVGYSSGSKGFLPSFVENQESQQVDNFDQSFDQHVTPHDVEEIDSKLDAPLPRKTRVDTTFGIEQVDLACFSTLCDADEPDSFEQALECVQWKDAMQQEIDSIHKNHTWDLVDLPTGKKPIGTKWIFKVKRKQDGTVDRYKARLVAKGYAQQKDIDYDETFAPTSRASTVRSLVAIAAHHNWKVHQLDIKTAFLNGDLQEEVYVSQPSGFVVKGQEQKVCRLRKALYGLKQAPRAWYEKIHTYLIGQGFQNSPTESTLYVKKRDAVLIMLTLYVDDMLLTGNNENENATFKDALQKTFEMFDLGLLHYYLGIQFVQSENGIYMSQAKYLHKILDKFGMQNCKPISTPVDTGSKMSMHDVGDPFDVHTYAAAIGCLIYLTGNTRPDIQIWVSQASSCKKSSISCKNKAHRGSLPLCQGKATCRGDHTNLLSYTG